MNIVAVIVARNGSSRIPGKSMLKFSGKPLIWHMIRIAKNIKGISKVCLATSELKIDDSLAEVAQEEHIELYRGDSENVLDRIFHASNNLKADIIVYIGGDCPLLDSNIVSDAIDVFIDSKCDYLNNYEPPTFPGGQDINIISFLALKKAYDEAISPSQRIHAFSYLSFHPNKFIIKNYTNTYHSIKEIDTYHWSLDYPEDILFIRKIYKFSYKKNTYMKMSDVLSLIRSNKQLSELHTNLRKPRVKHSFFSSPSIMEDINNDIVYLSKEAIKYILNKDFDSAERYYYEISCITLKLSNIRLNK